VWISLWCAPVDWALFDRLHADDFEDCSAGGRGTTKEALAGGLARLVRAFPELKTEVDDLVVDETTGKVAVRWSSLGTNREIIEVRDARIVRRWGEWDITAHG
jgi:predicted ester cyclase